MNTSNTNTTVEATPRADSKTSLMGSLSKRRMVGDIVVHAFLAIMAVIWLLPIVWVVAESFNKDPAPYTKTFFPREFSLNNYIKIFTDRSVMDFPRMYLNTFIIACFTCVISVFFVLMVAYVMSRMRFRLRRTFMSVV